MKRLLTAMVAVALAAVLAGQAGAQQQQEPYFDPDWAPQWFKDCQGFKQWAYWAFDTNFENDILPPTLWQKNYADTQFRPELKLSGIMSLGAGELFADNTYYNQPRMADFSIRMDNVPRSDYYKQVWLQFDVWASESTVSGSVGQLNWPPPKPLVELRRGTDWTYSWSPTGGYYRVTAYYEIVPQPDWEKIAWNFIVPAGSTLRVDNVKMLTQCNPVAEPVFFQMGALLGLSGLGMLKLRRR
ncbi:MAG: hypothetical protein ACUVSM_10985 [Armatimonadota bacterium]